MVLSFFFSPKTILQDYLGGVIVFVAIITALFAAEIYPQTTTPSLVGLAINYTLLIPIYLNWVVKLLADMEMYVGAVERIEHFIENEHQLVKQMKEKCKCLSSMVVGTLALRFVSFAGFSSFFFSPSFSLKFLPDFYDVAIGSRSASLIFI